MKVFDYMAPQFQEEVSALFERSEPLKQHLEKYWRLAKEFADKGDHTMACFFALTLIEESAKIFFMFFSEGRTPRKPIYKSDGGKDAFVSHKAKYRAMTIMFIHCNPRVDAIYEIDAKQKFEAMSNSDALVNMRHNCLLFRCEGKEISLPEKLVSLEEAALVTFFCGEIYAEMQEWMGDEGAEYDRITDEVAKLRKLLE